MQRKKDLIMVEQELLYKKLENVNLRKLLKQKKYKYLKKFIKPYQKEGSKIVRAKIVKKGEKKIYEAYEKEKYLCDFSCCDFLAEVTFCNCLFSEGANFEEAIFSERATFETIFSGKANFTEATFSKEASFMRATFSEEVNFTEATFSEGAIFVRAKFSGEANFTEATFSKEASFMRAKFSGEANFRKATFSELVQFKNILSKGNMYFDGAKFENKVNFEYAIFEQNICDLPSRIEAEDDSKETYRAIKHQLYKQNDYLEAHDYYVKEMESYRKKLENDEEENKLLDEFTLNVQRVMTNYGQDWFRGLRWIIEINYITTIILWILYGNEINPIYNLTVLYHIIILVGIICLLFAFWEECFSGCSWIILIFCVLVLIFYRVYPNNKDFFLLFLTLMNPLDTIRETLPCFSNGLFDVIEFIINIINLSLIYLVISAFRRFSRNR